MEELTYSFNLLGSKNGKQKWRLGEIQDSLVHGSEKDCMAVLVGLDAITEKYIEGQ